MPTRAQLLARAAVRANMDQSGFPTTSQRIDILNEQAGSLWVEMINNNYPAKRTVATINAVSGTSSYSIGAPGLFRVEAVWDYRSTFPVPLRRANNLERSRSLDTFGATPMYDIEVDPLAGPSVVLIPSTLEGVFKVDYFSAYPGLTDDSSFWYGPPPSDEVLVLRTAAAMVEKLDPTAAGNLRSEANARLSELWHVCNSLATPQRMIDRVSYEEGWCFEDS